MRRNALIAAVLVFAAGLLAQYSAGPYAVAIVAAYFWWRRSRWSKRAFWAEAVICARLLKAAGKPPVRGGFKGIKHILYAYDPMNRSVVIGPIAKDAYGVVPPLLEEGGRGEVVSQGKTRQAVFRARPFMGPAFRKVQPELPRLWSGSVVAKA